MKFVLADTEKTRPLGITESVTEVSKAEGTAEGKEIFFESSGKILSGRLLMPKGADSFPAVIFVFDDGPLTNAEKSLFDFYTESLITQGFAVMTFYKPGQEKSQGDIIELDDEKRIQNIRDAFAYLKNLPEINSSKIVLMGYKGGGYLALRAAEEDPGVNSCIALGMPLEYYRKDDLAASSRERIEKALQENGYNDFEEGYMNRVSEKMAAQVEDIIYSKKEDFSFIMGERVPVSAHRKYITRLPIRAVLAFNRPLLIIFGQNDTDFNAQLVEQLKKELRAKKEENATIAVFRNLDGYMGKRSKQKSLHSFKASSDALLLVQKWLSKREELTLSAKEPAVEEIPPSVPDEEDKNL
jgi:dienelactone hydrolase